MIKIDESLEVSNRILVVCLSETWGGIEKNVLLRIKKLLERNVSVSLMMLHNTFEEKFADLEGLNLITVNRRWSDLLPFMYLEVYFVLKKFKPDCVFVALKRDWWLFSSLSFLLSVPKVVLYLGIYRKIKSNLKYKFLFHTFGSHLLVNSHWLKEKVMLDNTYLISGNVSMIYNGFEINKSFKQGSSKIMSELLALKRQGFFIVGCAGRLSNQKGFDLLPDILDLLPSDVRIVVVGEGQQRERLEILFSERGYSDQIILLGHCQDMLTFYQNIDLFLLTSRNEGLANVLIEALANRLPIVATNASGSAELIEASDDQLGQGRFNLGQFGLLADIDDFKGLANGILVLKDDPTIIKGNHLEKINNNFHVDQMIDQSLRLFFNHSR